MALLRRLDARGWWGHDRGTGEWQAPRDAHLPERCHAGRGIITRTWEPRYREMDPRKDTRERNIHPEQDALDRGEGLKNLISREIWYTAHDLERGLKGFRSIYSPKNPPAAQCKGDFAILNQDADSVWSQAPKIERNQKHPKTPKTNIVHNMCTRNTRKRSRATSEISSSSCECMRIFWESFDFSLSLCMLGFVRSRVVHRLKTNSASEWVLYHEDTSVVNFM
jgi:hypothetical protein